MGAEEPLLQPSPLGPPTDGPPGAAAADPFIDEMFGAFQWRVCVLVGAIVYLPAGWIMLPVFVNPQLVRDEPEIFTENRLALLGSAFFAGWAIGAPIGSTLADGLGRKRLLLSVLPLAIVAGLLPALPEAALHWLPEQFLGHPQYYILHLVARALLGFSIGGMSCGFVWMVEWMPSNSRSTVTVAMNCVWAGFAILIALLAMALGDGSVPGGSGSGEADSVIGATWPVLQFASSLPFIIVGLVMYFFVPESARWLLSVDRT